MSLQNFIYAYLTIGVTVVIFMTIWFLLVGHKRNTWQAPLRGAVQGILLWPYAAFSALMAGFNYAMAMYYQRRSDALSKEIEILFEREAAESYEGS